MRESTKYLEDVEAGFTSYRKAIRYQLQKVVQMIMEHDVTRYKPIVIR